MPVFFRPRTRLEERQLNGPLCTKLGLDVHMLVELTKPVMSLNSGTCPIGCFFEPLCYWKVNTSIKHKHVCLKRLIENARTHEGKIVSKGL